MSPNNYRPVPEVIEESRLVRNALETAGWRYVGGGPYPERPLMEFVHRGRLQRLSVHMNPEPAPATLRENSDDS